MIQVVGGFIQSHFVISSFYILELMRCNGEFVFSREKKSHLLLKIQKTFSSPPRKTRISSIEGVHYSAGINFERRLFKQSFLLILQV